jgi:hypothetical protein
VVVGKAAGSQVADRADRAAAVAVVVASRAEDRAEVEVVAGRVPVAARRAVVVEAAAGSGLAVVAAQVAAARVAAARVVGAAAVGSRAGAAAVASPRSM